MLIRLLIAIVLFAHGVGHLLFVANSWGFWRGGEAGRSWLLSGLLGAGQAVEGILGLLWLVPLVGFVAVSWGTLPSRGGGRSWRWPPRGSL